MFGEHNEGVCSSALTIPESLRLLFDVAKSELLLDGRVDGFCRVELFEVNADRKEEVDAAEVRSESFRVEKSDSDALF